MNDTQAWAGTPREGGEYEIRLQGHLDPRWTPWFDGLVLTIEPGGTTVVRGHVVDQTALHGLLQKIRDLGLPLVSVVSVGAGRPDLRSAEPSMTSPPTKGSTS